MHGKESFAKSPGLRPMACQIISITFFKSTFNSVPPFKAAFGFTKRLTAGPRPWELSKPKPSHPLLSCFLLSILFLTPIFFEVLLQLDPILNPMLAPCKTFFCRSFSDHFSTSSDFIVDGFRTPNRLQNQSKIYQHFVPKSIHKQALSQRLLRSNFEGKVMFKQNGRVSKNIQKHCAFVCVF